MEFDGFCLKFQNQQNISLYLLKILEPYDILFSGGLTHMAENPFSSSSTKISWYKDGQEINTANPIISSRIKVFGKYLEQLKISSVRPEDVGLYQCFLSIDETHEFQAASELRLGGKRRHIFHKKNKEYKILF